MEQSKLAEKRRRKALKRKRLQELRGRLRQTLGYYEGERAYIEHRFAAKRREIKRQKQNVPQKTMLPL